MPLGNLTSQFFANVYLNELDYYIKHRLKARYYIRYVDDFLILHTSRGKLQEWKEKIDTFLREKIKIELHPEKSKIISLGRPIPFMGLKIFYHHKLLKGFNRRNVQKRVHKLHQKYEDKVITYDKIYEVMQGTLAYMKHANTYRLQMKMLQTLRKKFPQEISDIEVDGYLKSLESQKKLSKYMKH